MNATRTGALLAALLAPGALYLTGCSGGDKALDSGADTDGGAGGTTGGTTSGTDGGTDGGTTGGTDGGTTGGTDGGTTGGTDGGTTGGTDGGTDGGTTGGTDGGTTDTGPQPLLGLIGLEGSATVTLPPAPSAGYHGSEDIYLIGDKGDGEDVCRVRYDLDSVAGRDDCTDCTDFAFDLVISNTAVVTESGSGCAGALGLDAAALDAMNGQIRSYGYNNSYYGHAAVLVYEDPKAGWQVVAFATLDTMSGELTYNWEQGYYEYF